jgi:hypothetical protein
MRKHTEACNYHRLWNPHKNSRRVAFIPGQPDDLKPYKAVMFHKGYCSIEAIQEVHKAGLKVIIDFDDWIEVEPYHLLAKDYNAFTECFKDYLSMADLVTCSTVRLATELKKFAKWVEVLPNALNEGDLIYKDIKRQFLTFGYMGGKCHLPDLKQYSNTTEKLQKDLSVNNRFKIALFGYYNDEVKNGYYNILSVNGKYKGLMNLFGYVEADKYLEMYNYLDVSLAPLLNDRFNSFKSELKLVEAGFYRKPVICSFVPPYSDAIPRELVIPVDNAFQWYKQMKFLIQNPNAIYDYGIALYDYVKKYYDLNKINKMRWQIYDHLLLHK